MFLRSLLLSLAVAVVPMAHADGVGVDSDIIKIVIGFSPGGSSDRTARILQEILAKRTGKTVIIGYKPGAGGDIANREVATDTSGQPVLLLRATSNIIMGVLRQTTAYNYNQLKPVIYLGEGPLILISAQNSKYSTLDSILTMPSSEAPNFGSSGIGSGTHISAQVFFDRIDRKMTHIPYKGNSQVMPDLLAGRLDLAWGFPAATVNYIREGRLNALAVAGPDRLATLPNVPTLEEHGLGDAYSKVLYMIFASPGTSDADLSVIQTVLSDALADPSVAKKFADNADVHVDPSKTLQAHQVLAVEFELYQEVVKRSPEILVK